MEAALNHNTGKGTVITGAAHNDLTQPTEDTATYRTMTLLSSHIAGDSNTEGLQVINPAITVDHIHDHPTDVQDMNLTDQDSYSRRLRRRLYPKRNIEGKIEDPHTDYSSNDHSSDSGEDCNPLN